VVVVDSAPVGEQLAVVVEQDDAVAQQAPALLGVAADHSREITCVAAGIGTGQYVVAHRHHIRFDPAGGSGNYLKYSSDYGLAKSALEVGTLRVTQLTRSPQ
jgi:hypothetical protein